MPHLVILYTANLDLPAENGGANMGPLTRKMADALLAVKDEAGKQVFPTGGTRVFALPAPHFAVADGGATGKAAGGDGHYAFVYLNVRMAKGRSADIHFAVGKAVENTAREHFAQHLANRHIGITVQVDEGHEVFDAKVSSIHPLFAKPAA